MTRTERRIATPHGEARLVTDRAPKPRASLLLSHGAGAGIDTWDLELLAHRLPRRGFTVVRLEQPWKVAGRRIATPPPTLDEGLVAGADALRGRVPLLIGGRSAGARSAARCARGLGAVGVLALSFPLHPPGRPERSRLPELRGVRLPLLVVQGERDPMGRPEELPPDVETVVVPGGDHGLKVPARAALGQEEAGELVVDEVVAWLGRVVGG